MFDLCLHNESKEISYLCETPKSMIRLIKMTKNYKKYLENTKPKNSMFDIKENRCSHCNSFSSCELRILNSKCR